MTERKTTKKVEAKTVDSTELLAVATIAAAYISKGLPSSSINELAVKKVEELRERLGK